MNHCFQIALLCAIVFAAPIAAAEPAYRIERIDGDPVAVDEFRVEDDAVIAAGSPEPIPLRSIVAIVAGKPSLDVVEPPASLIWLTNGDRLAATPTRIDEETLAARWTAFPDRESLAIPLEYVAAMTPQLPAALRRRLDLLRSLALDKEPKDAAWLVNGDRLVGEFVGFDNGEYQWKANAGPLPILPKNLRAIRFAADLVAEVPRGQTRYLLTLNDGSRITATKFSRTADQLQFVTSFANDLTLPASALSEMHVASPKIALLSECEPQSFQHTPFVGSSRPMNVDRNVAYGPLSVRGRPIAFGLGVQSRSEIVYQVKAGDREFRAEVGIDDIAEEGGSAVFVVAVDGREIWNSGEVTGTMPAVPIPPISLQGAKQLTLRVDFGQFSDVQDYADWCHSVVIQK